MACNEDKIVNTVNREFNNRDKLEVVISDLTYVRVNAQCFYICVLLDLHNKEINCMTEKLAKNNPRFAG